MYLGILAVISSPWFVSPSLSTYISLTPVNWPLLKAKNTLLPEPTGDTVSKLSYSVVTLTEVFPGVKLAPPVNINCVWSENNKSFSSKATACFKILTFVWATLTSITSVSNASVTVSLKNSKNSEDLDIITFSFANTPSLFLWKKISFIFASTKLGLGELSKSPTVLLPQLGTSKLVDDIV